MTQADLPASFPSLATKNNNGEISISPLLFEEMIKLKLLQYKR
jgi:hypothetical protein